MHGSPTRQGTRRKGKVKQTLGRVTADRRVEAEGVFEAETGREPDQAELRATERRVRVSYGEARR